MLHVQSLLYAGPPALLVLESPVPSDVPHTSIPPRIWKADHVEPSHIYPEIHLTWQAQRFLYPVIPPPVPGARSGFGRPWYLRAAPSRLTVGSHGEWTVVDAAEFLSVYSLTCRADDLALIFSDTTTQLVSAAFCVWGAEEQYPSAMARGGQLMPSISVFVARRYDQDMGSVLTTVRGKNRCARFPSMCSGVRWGERNG